MMVNAIIKGEIKAGSNILIMIHGRGANAEDILSIADHLSAKEFTLIAPQAPGHTWYPFSFMAPPWQNEPHLSNALSMINEIVENAKGAGVNYEDMYFLGFSQGACLTLEYTTRHAKKWGGIIAFTGGLIGDKLNLENYTGDFKNTNVYIGSSNPDPHVPVERVKETERLLLSMNANVKVDIFENMGHTIVQEEIQQANGILSGN